MKFNLKEKDREELLTIIDGMILMTGMDAEIILILFLISGNKEVDAEDITKLREFIDDEDNKKQFKPRVFEVISHVLNVSLFNKNVEMPEVNF